MADQPKPTKSQATKKRATPVVICPAKTVPISQEDYEQAITALAVMIADWWHQQTKPSP